MKKFYIVFLLLTVCSMKLFAEPNYNGGNGTIISSTNENGIVKTIRKCEINNIKIGDLLNEKNRDIFGDYNFETKIGKLKDNDEIKVIPFNQMLM